MWPHLERTSFLPKVTVAVTLAAAAMVEEMPVVEVGEMVAVTLVAAVMVAVTQGIPRPLRIQLRHLPLLQHLLQPRHLHQIRAM